MNNLLVFAVIMIMMMMMMMMSVFCWNWCCFWQTVMLRRLQGR